MRTARDLASLEAEVLSLLPQGLLLSPWAASSTIYRGPVAEHTLLLLAAHGAAAARVRQVVPTLLSRLQQRGSQVTAIQVRVQPEADAATGTPARSCASRRQGSSSAGVASMDELARACPSRAESRRGALLARRGAPLVEI